MESRVKTKFEYINGLGSVEVLVYHQVYILFKNETPIYVGCSNNIKARLRNHKKTKEFDSYSIVFSNAERCKSLDVERSLITAIKYINPKSLNMKGFVLISDCEIIKFK
jgi:hypothetical protein